MANEITVGVNLRGKLNATGFNFSQAFNKTFNNVSVTGGNPGTVTLTTSEADISFGSITPAWLILFNQSTGTWARLGEKSTGGALNPTPGIHLPPKGPSLVAWSTGATLRGKTTSGTANVYIAGLKGPATT